MSSRTLITVTLAAVLAAWPGHGRDGGHAAAPSGPVYSHTAYSQVHLSGDIHPGGLDPSYLPAPCWVEARFTGQQSYTHGDPRAPYGPGFDADTYWWWFAGRQPALMYLLGHIPGIRRQVNQTFEHYQGLPGWWWVPAWVDDGQGYACAQGLVDRLNLNGTYLDFQAPSRDGTDSPGHTMDGAILADLARAALSLPTITVRTSPSAPGHPSDVNLPTWVWVSYHGPMRPHDVAWVPLPGGGVLSASVRASRPRVSVSVDGPAGDRYAQVHNHCGARGSPYPGTGGPEAVPACGVTFLAPSVAGPFRLTVTVRWTVTWSDSTGHGGLFTSPPYRPSVVASTVLVSVREIQAVNHG